MAHFRSILVSAALLSAYAPLSAQWLHYPTFGIPRTPDRKPERLRSGAEKLRTESRTFPESGRPWTATGKFSATSAGEEL